MTVNLKPQYTMPVQTFQKCLTCLHVVKFGFFASAEAGHYDDAVLINNSMQAVLGKQSANLLYVYAGVYIE
jgi:hypothetical protein